MGRWSCRPYVAEQLKTKPNLDQQDMMMLASVQQQFGIKQDALNQIISDAVANVLQTRAHALLNSRGTISADAVKDFRDSVEAADLKLRVDLGLNRGQLRALFRAEAEAIMRCFDRIEPSGHTLRECTTPVYPNQARAGGGPVV